MVKKLGLLLIGALAFVAVSAGQAGAQDSSDGEWSPVVQWGLMPIHSVVLPDGKLLTFGTDSSGIQGGNYIHALWDPKTGENKILPNVTGANMFCSNMAVDPNSGDVIISGGDQYRYGGAQWSGIPDVVKFDYRTQTIRRSETGNMNYARWYGSMVTLSTGDLLSLGGRDGSFNGSTIPEIYETDTGYRTLPGAEIIDFLDDDGSLRGTYYYAHAWQTSDGKVFVVEADGRGGEASDMYRMDVTGNGSVERLGKLPFATRNLSPGLLYDVDKAIITGLDGWVWKADLSQPVPTWTRAFFMWDMDNRDRGIARTNGYFLPTPDGKVAIVGGSDDGGLLADSSFYAQHTLLLWDPETNELTETSRGNRLRTYHSSAAVLPDGRVWVGGNGAPGIDQLNSEVFSPPYLYASEGVPADRPEILLAPSNVTAGDTFEIVVEDASVVDAIGAVKTGAATHGRNNDTRYVKLDFEIIDNNTIEITTPGSNIMIPGVWMLSTVTADGVPSESSILGVNMIDIEDAGGVNPTETVFYNIEDEQIDGPFEITVEARFDDLTSRNNQRIFDYGNGPLADNIWFGQVDGTDDIALAVVRNGTERRVVATDAIVEDELATWMVDVSPSGLMSIYKNGVVQAQGPGFVPADVERTSNLIGRSNTAGHDEMDGLVRNLVIVNNETGQNNAPTIEVATSLLIGQIFEPGDVVADEAANGFVRFTDPDEADTHTATMDPNGTGYLGEFVIEQPTTTSTTTIGQVDWTFSASEAELNFLASGEQRMQTYTVIVDDGRGGQGTAEVLITITGTNDAPTINVQGSTLSGSVAAQDDVEGATTGGNVVFDDLDVADTHTASISPTGTGYLGQASAATPGSNSVGWSFSIGDSELASIEPGQSVVQTYELTVDDGFDGLATATVTVTVNGPGQVGASVEGAVSFEGGSPAVGVRVNLFTDQRQTFLGLAVTDDQGRYRFNIDEPGCHVVTFIAPDGEAWAANGGQYVNSRFCAEPGETVTGIDAVLASETSSGGVLSGAVTSDGAPVAGVKAVLFEANADGGRGAWIGPAFTGDDGVYSFDVEPGCYVIDLVAPDGRTWQATESGFIRYSGCVESGQSVETLGGVLNPEPAG